ncbi:sulfurtransferase complex subunit TusC [Hahella ganghwensis]|uniref:sulfurtransferase complex subunit TusC n=1 Tax=Hahella ganghwensis TaxID=286420 RepID=UPI00037E0DB1|nr:sulfurtransferase complex subunit TusC [Hahella ganghwensis]
MSAKRLLFIFSASPFGNSLGSAGLDAVLAASVFDQDVTLIFQMDGIYQLVDGGNSASIGLKDYRKGFKALEMYGVDKVIVDAADLNERGLTGNELAIPVQLLTRKEIAAVIQQADTVLSF